MTPEEREAAILLKSQEINDLITARLPFTPGLVAGLAIDFATLYVDVEIMKARLTALEAR